jgi:hypothetical protein
MNYDISAEQIRNPQLDTIALENVINSQMGQVMQQIGVPPINYQPQPKPFASTPYLGARGGVIGGFIPKYDWDTTLSDEQKEKLQEGNKNNQKNNNKKTMNFDLKKLLSSKEMYIGLAVGFLILPKVLKKRY